MQDAAALPTPSEPVELATWDWVAELDRQERDRMWLARKTGVGYRSVYRYAAGTVTPPTSFLMAAAAVLGVALVALHPPERGKYGDSSGQHTEDGTHLIGSIEGPA